MILAGFRVVSNRDAGETPVPSSLDSAGCPRGVESRRRRKPGTFEPGFRRLPALRSFRTLAPKRKGSEGPSSRRNERDLLRQVGDRASLRRAIIGPTSRLSCWRGFAAWRRRRQPPSPCDRANPCQSASAACWAVPRATTVLRAAIEGVARGRGGGSPGGVGSRCRRNSGAFESGFWRVFRWVGV